MPSGDGDHQLGTLKQEAVEPVREDFATDQGQVNCPLDERVDRSRGTDHSQVDLNVRMLTEESAKPGGDPVLSERVARGNRYATLVEPSVGGRNRFNCVHVLKCGPRTFQERLARLRQLNPTAAPLEKPEAQSHLQQSQLLGHGRPGQVKILCGPTLVAGFGHSQEGVQLIQRDGGTRRPGGHRT